MVISINGHISLQPINFPIKPVLIFSPLNYHLTPQSGEMKFFRSIEKKTRRDKIRNEVIRHTLEIQQLINIIEKSRLIWFGHLKRMEDRKTMEMVVKGTRTLGRPRTRWLDQVKMDLKEKGCSWERIQDEELWQDRTLWRRLCSETTHN